MSGTLFLRSLACLPEIPRFTFYLFGYLTVIAGVMKFSALSIDPWFTLLLKSDFCLQGKKRLNTANGCI